MVIDKCAMTMTPEKDAKTQMWKVEVVGNEDNAKHKRKCKDNQACNERYQFFASPIAMCAAR
jgi:hypothetical protein